MVAFGDLLVVFLAGLFTALAAVPFFLFDDISSRGNVVLSEFVPEALSIGSDLRRGGIPELAGGLAAGILVTVPLLLL